MLMSVLFNWRISPRSDNEFILVGTDKYGRKIEYTIKKNKIKSMRLHTSYIEIIVNMAFCYRLWYKDADMSKPITPMRVMKRNPQKNKLDALYCLMAEVSMYICGFSKEVDKDYLKTEKSIGVFFNDDPADEYGFCLDIAIKLLLQAAGVE